jgi:hypothetical protein
MGNIFRCSVENGYGMAIAAVSDAVNCVRVLRDPVGSALGGGAKKRIMSL